MQSWVEDELQTVDLGDRRLNQRYARLLDQMSSKPNESIPAACGGWADIQAGYRFFANEKVPPEKVLAPHRDATIERCRQHPVILVPQDTTELDCTRPTEKVGGPLSDEQHWGFHVHPCLALTPDRIALGVFHAHMWARAISDYHKRLQTKSNPIEDKESLRCLEGYHQACMSPREITGRD